MAPELWLALAAVVAGAAVLMVALGPAGDPGVPRRGPVLRAVDERRSSTPQEAGR